MSDRPVRPTTRRAVLAGFGTAAAATALAACSSGSDSPTSAGTATTPAAPSPSGSSGSPGGTSLGSTADIPVGGGKIFQEQQVVVTQPTQGDLKCFTAVCTHQGCIVHDVTGGTINCACHGSKYNMTTGAVVQGPAPRALAAEKITVANNTITLTG